MKIRFVHADPNLGQISLKLNDLVIRDLSFGNITPYTVTTPGKLFVKNNGVLVFDRKIAHVDGLYTAVIAPGSDFVLYKDTPPKNVEGTSSLHFYHLGADLPAVNIMLDGKEVIGDLAYLQIKKTTLDLGAFFHTLRVTNAGKDVLPSVMISPSNRSRYNVFFMSKNKVPLPVVVNQLATDELQPDFSVEDYMGEWNLISEFSQPYEQAFNCGNQKAVYTLLHDGVKVHNTCLDASGKVINEVYGKATTPDKTRPAALRVDFPNPSGGMPTTTGANYLVHKTNYTDYAVVGSPSRSSFYILSRNKTMSTRRHESLIRYGKELGYDMSKLKVMENTIV